MDLAPGKSLAHYRLADKIGEGGMGVVWRAQDTTLGRDVAIKILPDIFAHDADRLARFEREAKVLASLNHPNIAAVYGLHEIDGLRFLAMELAPGEDYAQRLKGGPLPLDEALRVAGQVAEALEAAHAIGIVHRDLKPANIKSEAGGRVKVLDFGLAKALEGDAPSGDLSLSPTLTGRATQAGVILGTAAYMSPEQARGRAVDRRADIWAFGVILFEMLTGQRLFDGETVSDTLAAVLKTNPDWSALPAATPVPVRRLLRRCLEKDPRRRLRDIGDALLEIEQALAGHAAEDAAAAEAIAAEAVAAGAGATAVPVAWKGRLVAGVAVAALIATAGGVFVGRSMRPAAELPPLRKFEVEVENLDTDAAHRPQLSPDGNSLLYFVQGDLWLRSLADLKAREVTGGERSGYAFWSPDSSTVGFFRDGKIWKIPISGGQAGAVCALPAAPVSGSGGAWRRDGSLVFSVTTGPLYEVPPRGGDPRPILQPQANVESDFHDPHILPDGRSVVFVVHRKEGMDTLAALVDGKRKVLLQMKDQVLSVPTWSPSGHLLYRRGGIGSGLWAAPLSAAKVEIAGDPFLVVADAGHPSAGADGSLAYFSGEAGLAHLVWINRAGQVTGTIGQAQEGISLPAISPDGTRVAVSAQEAENRDIWIHDAVRGTKTRLTFDPGVDISPAWNPTGDRIFFTRVGSPSTHIYIQPTDGTGPAEEIAVGQSPDVSADGHFLAYVIGNYGTADLMSLRLDGDRKPSEWVPTPSAELWPQISPDGRYLAYESNESGREEIYIRRFPEGEGRWQVSATGGVRPRWSPKGNELFFVADDDLMAVEVQTLPTLTLGTPKKLFSGRPLNLSALRNYDVAPDGQRFVAVQRESTATLPRITVVQSWFREFAAAK